MSIVLGRCHSEGACWRGSRGEASGACSPACSPSGSRHRSWRKGRPRRRSISASPAPSRTRRTGSSCLLTLSSSFLPFSLYQPLCYVFFLLLLRLQVTSAGTILHNQRRVISLRGSKDRGADGERERERERNKN